MSTNAYLIDEDGATTHVVLATRNVVGHRIRVWTLCGELWTVPILHRFATLCCAAGLGTIDSSMAVLGNQPFAEVDGRRLAARQFLELVAAPT